MVVVVGGGRAAESRQATNCHLRVREGKRRRRERKTEKKRVKNATLKAGKGKEKQRKAEGRKAGLGEEGD